VLKGARSCDSLDVAFGTQVSFGPEVGPTPASLTPFLARCRRSCAGASRPARPRRSTAAWSRRCPRWAVKAF
jgi:hypothetical protein